ncbi:MAG: response regulator [Candidatus Pacebacteria bacterium]|jgi:CheY-like chemotaxis protein|nr:response regulator [Candidatus Paceibacterota bacterium]
MKILLVDDDTFLRDMYATKFIECGHNVTTAIHATDALRLLEQDSNYDLVIVDMIMPGMTGIELMSELRKIYPDTKTKFIVLSNQGQDQDLSEAKEAGAIGYIIKAQSIPSEVVKRVEEIIQENN